MNFTTTFRGVSAQQQNDYGNTIEYEEPTYAEDEFGQPIAPDTQTEPEQGEAFDSRSRALRVRLPTRR